MTTDSIVPQATIQAAAGPVKQLMLLYVGGKMHQIGCGKNNAGAVFLQYCSVCVCALTLYFLHSHQSMS